MFFKWSVYQESHELCKFCFLSHQICFVVQHSQKTGEHTMLYWKGQKVQSSGMLVQITWNTNDNIKHSTIKQQ